MNISYQGLSVDQAATAEALNEYAKGSNIPKDKVWLQLVSDGRQIRLEIKHTKDMTIYEKIQSFFGVDVYGFKDVSSFLHDKKINEIFLKNNMPAKNRLATSIRHYNDKCWFKSSKIPQGKKVKECELTYEHLKRISYKGRLKYKAHKRRKDPPIKPF